MVLVTHNWRAWMIATAASLLIFGVLYFTVIKPDNNTAQQALKSGLQQSQQVINQTKKDLSSAASQGGQGGQAAAKAQATVNKAGKLTACVAAAGTDVSKVQACQAKFGG